MTIVDTGDLHDRTCRRCGAVYGDALAHRRWHATIDEREDIATMSAALDRMAQAQVDGFDTMVRLLRIAFTKLGISVEEPEP